VLLLLKFWVHSLIPSEPDWVADIAARNNFIVEKFANGFEDGGDDLVLDELKGQLDETIDADAIDLSEFREGESRRAFNRANARAEVIALEQQRRALLKTLGDIKEELRDVFRKENFNAATGVGESKDGVPLGKITMRLNKLHFETKDLRLLGDDPKVQLRITVKALRAGAPPPAPPMGPTNFTRVIDATALQMQSKITDVLKASAVGPFAPISSADAEIVIDILDKRPGRNDMLLGSASLRLKEISDQESHDFVLRFKMRMENGDLLPTESSLFFNVIFQYSKAQPVRARIAQAKEALRAVELELARMKAGLEPDGAAEEEEEA